MIESQHVPEVEADEMMARFILSSRHIRSSDGTVRPEAFIPHPHEELSVTRHRDSTDDEIWNVGAAIATYRERRLCGRGDVLASVYLKQGLSVKAVPLLGHPSLPDNPNHANVTGWPKENKSRQRLLAQKIAAQVKLVRPSD